MARQQTAFRTDQAEGATQGLHAGSAASGVYHSRAERANDPRQSCPRQSAPDFAREASPTVAPEPE
jgi:hypothetical protein